MQAILRSRIPVGKHGTGTPTRIEVSFPLTGVTEATFTKDGVYDEEATRDHAMAEFSRLFGADFAQMAMSRRAVWTMEVI